MATFTRSRADASGRSSREPWFHVGFGDASGSPQHEATRTSPFTLTVARCSRHSGT
jgi:hypothetical protein